MERSQNMIQTAKRADGIPKREKAFTCKVCGKEGVRQHMISHIETNHLEGIYIPCDFCEKTFSARVNLRMHKSKYHK